MTYIVALSGGIASGKSTIANLFAKQGVPIIDADIIAREVVQPHSEALTSIADHFGKDILLPSGELDRAKLRKIIFDDPKARHWLNNLLHPLIAQRTNQYIEQCDYPYVLWVVPLLIENNLQSRADRILIIETNPEIQLTRLKNRDNIDDQLAEKMLLAQASNKKRRLFADDIIKNDLSINELKQQIILLHNKYLVLSRKKIH